MATPEHSRTQRTPRTGSAPPGPPEHTSWGTGLVLVCAGIVAAIQIGKPIAALPGIRAEFGLSLVASGWIVSTISLAGALTGVLIGVWADRLGHRRSVLLGLGLLAACGAVGAQAFTAVMLLASRFGEGIGFMLTVLAAPALLNSITSPRHHGMMFGLFSVFIPVGTTVAIVISPPLLAQGGWRLLWLVCALLAVAWLVVIALATRRVPTRTGQARPRALSQLRVVVDAPGVLVLVGIFAVYTAQYLSVTAFLPEILIKNLRLGSHEAILVTAVVTLLNAVGNFLGGWLAGRFVPRWLLITVSGLLVECCGVGIFANGVPLSLSAPCLVLYFLVSGTIPASVFSAAPLFAPDPSTVATTIGLVTQGALVGLMIGPPAAAATVTAMGGWHAMLGFFLIIAAATITGALLLRRVRPHQPAVLPRKSMNSALGTRRK
jgi:MFS family permease